MEELLSKLYTLREDFEGYAEGQFEFSLDNNEASLDILNEAIVIARDKIQNKLNDEFASFLEDNFDGCLVDYCEAGESVVSDDNESVQLGFNVGYLRGLEIAQRILKP